MSTPDLFHVSVGLLDEKTEGARADGWLEWHRERFSYGGKALDTAVAQSLAESSELGFVFNA